MIEMKQITYMCRVCKVDTKQIIVEITDLLPPHVKTLECTNCGAMSIGKVE